MSDSDDLDARIADLRASGDLDGGDDGEPRPEGQRWPIRLSRGEIRGLEAGAERRNERTR